MILALALSIPSLYPSVLRLTLGITKSKYSCLILPGIPFAVVTLAGSTKGGDQSENGTFKLKCPKCRELFFEQEVMKIHMKVRMPL